MSVALYRRLLPEPGSPVSAEEALSDLRLRDRAGADRPYLVLNMVSTVDGRASMDGRTAGISSEPDRQLFHALRTHVDAVMVGANTVRVERYGRLVRDPALRERRAAVGLAEDPVAVIVSASLRLPSDVPLLQEPEQKVVVLTTSQDELEDCAAQVSYIRGPVGSDLDLPAVLGRLRREHAIGTVLCEGGPHLNGSLLPAGLVDELFLSIAPTIAGGAGGLSIVMGTGPTEALPARLVWLLESEGELFARYEIGAPR